MGEAQRTAARSAAELTQATAKGLRWTSASRVLTEVVLLVSMVALARLIAPSAFGEFTIALIVQELALGIPAEGVGSALVQRDEITREHLQAGAALTLIAGALLSVITFLLAELLIAPLLGGPTASLVLISIPLFLMAALSVVPVAVLRRQLDFRKLAQIEIASSVTRAVVSLALAAGLGMQGSALALGGLAAGGVGTLIACASAPSPWPRLRRAAVRDISGFGLPASLAAICWAGFRNGDYAVLNIRLGAAAAGIYWRAYTLAVDYQRKITVVTYTVAFPILARTQGKEDLAALRRRIVRLLTVILFPLLTGLAVTTPILVPWLFGDDWRPAVVPAQILCAAGAVTLVTDAAGTALMAAGRARALLGFGLGHFAVYIGSVAIVSRWGLAAVAIDAATVHGMFLVVAYAMMLRGSGERALVGMWHDNGAALVCSAAMAAAMLPIDWLSAGLPAPVRLVCIGGVGVAAYLATLRIAFGSSWRDLIALVAKLLPASTPDRLQRLGGARLSALLAGRSG